MNFSYSDKVKDLLARVEAFMAEHILPAEDEKIGRASCRERV